MPSETEIERMVVRLTGDNSKYVKSLKDSTDQTKKYAGQVEKAARDASGKFVSAHDKMIAKHGKFRASLIQTGKSISDLGDKMSSLGRSMSLRVTAPIAAAATGSIVAFNSFDKAMTESTAIMGNLSDETKASMRQVALSLSEGGEVPQSAKELAESYFFLASAGKSAEQSMALLPNVARFATAGNFDMALATDLLTDAQSALGLSSKDVAEDTKNMARVADVLVKANTLANASVQQFSESLTNTAGASLKNFNKDVEEGVALLAAYADQGVKGNVAGTNLTRVMLLLSKSSRSAAKAHESLGFKVFDANGKMRNFADIVQNLEDITAGMSDETKAATLEMLGFEARVQQAILPLLGTSSAIRRYEAELRNAGGTVREVSEKQMKSFNNQMKVLKNTAVNLGIEIGEKLAPYLIKFGQWLRDAIKWVSSLDETTKSWVLAVAGIAAALGPVLTVGGLFLGFVGNAITGITTLTTTIGGLRIAALSARTALLGMIGAATLANKFNFNPAEDSVKNAKRAFLKGKAKERAGKTIEEAQHIIGRANNARFGQDRIRFLRTALQTANTQGKTGVANLLRPALAKAIADEDVRRAKFAGGSGGNGVTAGGSTAAGQNPIANESPQGQTSKPSVVKVDGSSTIFKDMVEALNTLVTLEQTSPLRKAKRGAR